MKWGYIILIPSCPPSRDRFLTFLNVYFRVNTVQKKVHANGTRVYEILLCIPIGMQLLYGRINMREFSIDFCDYFIKVTILYCNSNFMKKYVFGFSVAKSLLFL